MSWIFFALAAGILWASINITGKEIMEEMESFDFTMMYSWVAMLLYLPLFLYFLSSSSLGGSWLVWGALIVSGIGNVVGLLSLFAAIKNTDISVAMPIGKITPILVAFNAWIILGETLSLFNISGAVLVAVGSYVTLLKPDMSGFEPLKRVFTDRAVGFALLSAVSFSISGVGDRFATQTIPPELYTFMIFLFLTIALTLIGVYRGRISKACSQASGMPWLYLLVGVLAVLAQLSVFTAISLQKIGRVVPVMRIDMLISVVIGGELFHEEGIIRKVIGCILIIGGIAMVLV